MSDAIAAILSWLWPMLLTFLLGLFGVGAVGCNTAGLASPIFQDMANLLDKPAVKETLQNWSATADVTNPAIGFYWVTGGEIRATGMVWRGSATGASHFMPEGSSVYGPDQPTSQPSVVPFVGP